VQGLVDLAFPASPPRGFPLWCLGMLSGLGLALPADGYYLGRLFPWAVTIPGRSQSPYVATAAVHFGVVASV